MELFGLLAVFAVVGVGLVGIVAIIAFASRSAANGTAPDAVSKASRFAQEQAQRDMAHHQQTVDQINQQTLTQQIINQQTQPPLAL